MQSTLSFSIRSIPLMMGVLFILSNLAYAAPNNEKSSNTSRYNTYISEFKATFETTQSNISKKRNSPQPSKKQILKATENLGRRLGIIAYKAHKQRNGLSTSELKLFQKEVLNIFIQLTLYLQTISNVKRSDIESSFFRIAYAGRFTALGLAAVGAYKVFDSWWLASITGTLSVVPLRAISEMLQGPWYDLENNWSVPRAQKRMQNKLMRTFIDGAKQEGLDLSTLVTVQHPSINESYSAEFIQSVNQLIREHHSDTCLRLLIGSSSY